MRAQRRRTGLTVLEVVVLTVVFVVVIGLSLLLLPSMSRNGANTSELKDQAQLKQIHQAMIVWASENDGVLPLPGLIDRLPDPDLEMDAPGRGPEDPSVNHTAPVYSLMIAYNYITPDIVVGPTEVSDNIRVLENYNYEAYEPAGDSYWDTSFKADVRQLAHTSYAHMALCGERKQSRWRDTAPPQTVHLGNRGPKDGATTGKAFTQSMTLKLHDPPDLWVGNVVFADNHVETFSSPEPATLQTPGRANPFNIFQMDGGALGISIASTEDSVTRVWD